jgi:hypothetical protein
MSLPGMSCLKLQSTESGGQEGAGRVNGVG